MKFVKHNLNLEQALDAVMSNILLGRDWFMVEAEFAVMSFVVKDDMGSKMFRVTRTVGCETYDVEVSVKKSDPEYIKEWTMMRVLSYIMIQSLLPAGAILYNEDYSDLMAYKWFEEFNGKINEVKFAKALVDSRCSTMMQRKFHDPAYLDSLQMVTKDFHDYVLRLKKISKEFSQARDELWTNPFRASWSRMTDIYKVALGYMLTNDSTTVNGVNRIMDPKDECRGMSAVEKKMDEYSGTLYEGLKYFIQLVRTM